MGQIDLCEMRSYSNSRVYGHHHPGKASVRSHLDESKKTDYNKNLWNLKRLYVCRETELPGKRTLEARSFSLVEHHQAVRMRKTGGCDLLGSEWTREYVESYIHG